MLSSTEPSAVMRKRYRVLYSLSQTFFCCYAPPTTSCWMAIAIIRTDDYDSIRHSSYERTQRKIYKAEGLLSENFAFEKPIPLTGWADIFRTLKRYDIHVIIESIDGNSIDFRIGPIKRVTEKSVTIHNYDPDGKLEEKPTNIRYDAISIVQFGDRYSTVFRKYLK